MDDTTDPLTGKTRVGLHHIKADFESKYPGTTLEFVTMGWDDYVKKTQTMIMANESDVYLVPGIALMAGMDVLEPLQPYIDGDSEFSLDIYLDGQVEGWKVQSPNDTEPQIYSLPLNSDGRSTGYDKEIFDQWGVEYLSPQPTLEEIMEKAAMMTGTNPVTGEENYGIGWKGADSGDLFVNIAEGHGGTWGEGNLFNELTYNFNTEPFVQAAQYMKDLLPYAPEGVVAGAAEEAWGKESNNIAIYLRSGPLTRNLVQLGIKDQYGFAEPFYNAETGMGGMFAGGNFAIGKTSAQKELAWEFLKYSATDAWQEYGLENWNLLPAVKSGMEYDMIKEHADQYTPLFNAIQKAWTPRYVYRAAAPRGYVSSAVEVFMNDSDTIENVLNTLQADCEQWSSEQ